jgi:hypothetical protein
LKHGIYKLSITLFYFFTVLIANFGIKAFHGAAKLKLRTSGVCQIYVNFGALRSVPAQPTSSAEKSVGNLRDVSAPTIFETFRPQHKSTRRQKRRAVSRRPDYECRRAIISSAGYDNEAGLKQFWPLWLDCQVAVPFAEQYLLVLFSAAFRSD